MGLSTILKFPALLFNFCPAQIAVPVQSIAACMQKRNMPCLAQHAIQRAASLPGSGTTVACVRGTITGFVAAAKPHVSRHTGILVNLNV